MIHWIANHAGLVGLLFFFTLFVGVAIWLFLPGMKGRLEPLAQIPLREDTHE